MVQLDLIFEDLCKRRRRRDLGQSRTGRHLSVWLQLVTAKKKAPFVLHVLEVLVSGQSNDGRNQGRYQPAFERGGQWQEG